MANLPESSTFDAGVYQIETTDPVIGGPNGITNAPLKNLANRTKYLKDHVDALETSRAPLASPAFTGTPTAPTAAVGTNTTQIATTAFVQAQLSSSVPAASETVAGKVELATAAETQAGTDNTRAVTPAGLAAAGATKLRTPRTLTIGNTGKNFDGSADVSWSLAEVGVTAATETASGIVELATAAETQAGTDNTRAVTPAGLAAAFKGANQSLSGNGYQNLPGGLIIQWGMVDDASRTQANLSIPITFPVSFKTAVVSVNAQIRYGSAVVLADHDAWCTVKNVTLSGFNSVTGATTSTAVVYGLYWIAIGY